MVLYIIDFSGESMELLINYIYRLIIFVWDIAKIIFPLMIAIEIIKDLNLTNKLIKVFKPMTDFFSIDSKTGLSMAIGILFGLLYGAGAIIKNIEDDKPDKRSVFLVCMFLSLCHAVIEDSLIFTSIGASFFWIFMTRFLTACIFTYFLSKYLVKEQCS